MISPREGVEKTERMKKIWKNMKITSKLHIENNLEVIRRNNNYYTNQASIFFGYGRIAVPELDFHFPSTCLA